MNPLILLPVIAGVLIIGAIASAKGAVAQGDNKNSPAVPVPFIPLNNDGAIGYRYRGFYLAVREFAEGGFDWLVHSGVDFSVAAIAEGSNDTEDGALIDATIWVDNFRGGPIK